MQAAYAFALTPEAPSRQIGVYFRAIEGRVSGRFLSPVSPVGLLRLRFVCVKAKFRRSL